MKVLLFDMDGVLIEPQGYHRALAETVRILAKTLGYRNVNLTDRDIEVFELAGATSEWDSAAICAALLVRDVWKVNPDACLPTSPPLPDLPAHDLPSPDFQSFFRSLAQDEVEDLPALFRAERALLSGRKKIGDQQATMITHLLRGARRIEGSISHRLFQELVLGGQALRSTYGLEPVFSEQSYLRRYDRPMLAAESRRALLAWMDRPDQQAAVFTTRPSRPQPDRAGSPEAEFGLVFLGMEALPLVALGELSWIAEKWTLEPDSLHKPSPMHALIALRIALGDMLEAAASRSLAVVGGEGHASQWRELAGAEVCVFEDSTSGLYSARAAGDMLALQGVRLNLRMMGISHRKGKRVALAAAGADVFQDINSALDRLFK
jgi:hypothetical protein